MNAPAQTRLSLKFKRHVKGFPVKPVVVWPNRGWRGEGWGKQEYIEALLKHEMLSLASSYILKVKAFGHLDMANFYNYVPHDFVQTWQERKQSS